MTVNYIYVESMFESSDTLDNAVNYGISKYPIAYNMLPFNPNDYVFKYGSNHVILRMTNKYISEDICYVLSKDRTSVFKLSSFKAKSLEELLMKLRLYNCIEEIDL